MTNLSKYNAAFTKQLDEQLGVYVTIGTPYTESPMWFIFKEYDKDNECLKFQSSQNNYMFFSLPIDKEDRGYYFEWQPIADHFRTLKYEHIKANWPTVYYEIRKNEKPVIKEPVKIAVPFVREEETDYNKQATDFLTATGTTFTTTSWEHDYYFPEDKQTRDIYKIVLKNNKHRYRFTFGQSISNTGQQPTPYAVLACLTKYDPGTFENFCGDFGYDADSRKAYKTYKAVMEEWKNIELLFSTEQLEQLQEIQ